MRWHCLLGSLGKTNKISLPVSLELSASGAFETKWYFLQTEVKQDSYCAFLVHTLGVQQTEVWGSSFRKCSHRLCGIDVENTFSVQ